MNMNKTKALDALSIFCAGLAVTAIPIAAAGAGAMNMVQAAQSSGRPTPKAEAFVELDKHFRGQAEAGAFSGVVLVSQDGRALFERGYGLSNRDTKEPVTPDTRFNLASLNKLITRVAIYQLLEAGKLNLDDKVGAILPDYPNAAVRDQVTVRHLVEMRGGIPDIFNDKFKARHKSLRTTDDFTALFAEEPLRFQPGERREYSNGGYVILGKIVEQLSGMSYSDYVQKHIQGPAGMTSTSLDASNGARGTAVGYTRSSDMFADPDPATPPRSNQDFLPGRGSSAGGGYSTVRDFARLDAALRNGKLLKPATVDLLFKPAVIRGNGPVRPMMGGTTGANTVYLPFPDGLTLIIFANTDPPAAITAMEKTAELLGRPFPKAPGKAPGAAPAKAP